MTIPATAPFESRSLDDFDPLAGCVGVAWEGSLEVVDEFVELIVAEVACGKKLECRDGKYWRP